MVGGSDDVQRRYRNNVKAYICIVLSSPEYTVSKYVCQGMLNKTLQEIRREEKSIALSAKTIKQWNTIFVSKRKLKEKIKESKDK